MPVDLNHPVRATLNAVLDASRPDASGAVASYIPELAKVDAERLGIALASTRGDVHDAGDSDVEFTIQSVSKPFVFALALDALGLDDVTTHVGLEPSGEPFNAISLEATSGRPLNPMINAGAIVTTSLIARRHRRSQVRRRSRPASSGSPGVTSSSTRRCSRRRPRPATAIAPSPTSRGRRAPSARPVEVATTAYFRQCSLAVTARDLAIMAATLATGGMNPVTDERVISEDAARWTTAVMTSCGMYDESGELDGARRPPGEERGRRRHRRSAAGAVRHRHLQPAARCPREQRARRRDARGAVGAIRPAHARSSR